MRVTNSIPANEVEDHLRDTHCICDPDVRVDAAPENRVIVTITHHRLTTKEKP